MSGRISVYDARARRGRIRGLDGQSYAFTRQEFFGPAPTVGELVKFGVTSGRHAYRVIPIDRDWSELRREGERMKRSILTVAHL